MSHRGANRHAKQALPPVDAGGETLADLARERRDSRSYTIDYTGMGQGMVPAATELVQNSQKQTKKYLSELKGSTNVAHSPRKLLRSLSVPFLNSWDFNSIDITSQVRPSRATQPTLVFSAGLYTHTKPFPLAPPRNYFNVRSLFFALDGCSWCWESQNVLKEAMEPRFNQGSSSWPLPR